MSNRNKKYLISAVASAVIATVYVIILCVSCSGGKDPLGIFPDGKNNKIIPDDSSPDVSLKESRVIWDAYVLDIRPGSNQVYVRALERSSQAHFNVTSLIKKPNCKDCIQLSNVSFNESAGIIDLDAKLINPTKVGGYDVRAVLLLDEWGSGRRLLNEHSLTDFWSKDPWHPDPYLNYDRQDPLRYFGPMEQHSVHVKIYFPKPHDFLVPFIIDASYPDHPEEPVEIMNIKKEGSIHPTGYNLKISADVMDWQNNLEGVYIDCSVLNPQVGLLPMKKPQAGSSTWTIDMTYGSNPMFGWLPTVTGAVELPIVAKDSKSSWKCYQRISLIVEKDITPPQWTGKVGIEKVWWGGSQAIVSYYPATDPSGPVKYNIYYSTDMPLVPGGKHTVVGCAHYAVETVDSVKYSFVVKAQDQAGNEADNNNVIEGQTRALTKLWEQVFTADIDSSPTVIVGKNHYGQDFENIGDVVFGCDDGKVYCLNGATGQVRWSYATAAMIKGTPALRDINYDGLIDVVVGSNDSNVYALKVASGVPSLFKTFKTGNMVESSPVCADQTGDLIPEVVVGSFDGKLYAFAGGTGNLLVSYDTGAAIKATPSLEDFNNDKRLDVLVSSGGRIRAINGINGSILWSYDFKTGFSLGSPAIGDLTGDGVGDVVLGSGNSIYALDIKKHNLIWSNKSLEGNFDTSPALGDFNNDNIPDVAISSRYFGVYLLNGKNGSVIWASRDPIYMPTSPSIADVNADGVLDVIVGTADFSLKILNGEDGLTLYSYKTNPWSAITTVPLIADINNDGKADIIFGTEANQVIALTTNYPIPTTGKYIPWPKYMRNISNTGNLAHPLF